MIDLQINIWEFSENDIDCCGLWIEKWLEITLVIINVRPCIVYGPIRSLHETIRWSASPGNYFDHYSRRSQLLTRNYTISVNKRYNSIHLEFCTLPVTAIGNHWYIHFEFNQSCSEHVFFSFCSTNKLPTTIGRIRWSYHFVCETSIAFQKFNQQRQTILFDPFTHTQIHKHILQMNVN